MLSVLGDGAELRGADRSEVRRMREENGPRAIDVLVPIQRSLRRFDIEIREDISEVQAHLLKRVETVLPCSCSRVFSRVVRKQTPFRLFFLF